MNILLMEDEYSLRVSIREYLVELGYAVDEVRNGEEALDAIFEKKYDILLLDVKVPRKNGFELLHELRGHNVMTPVIFITSLTDIEQVEKAYEMGCCDYIRKPFELRELALRITQALKLEVFKTRDDFVKLPLGFAFEIKRHTLTRDGQDLQLTKREAAIIALLVENIGNIVSCDDFAQYVWGEDIDPANIRVQINNLRKKLGADLVVNIRGFGYKIDRP